MSSDEMPAKRVERYNAMAGDLVGFDCPKCKNKGDYMYLRDGVIYIARCGCLKTRADIERLKNSGLHKLSEQKTFDSYTVLEPWQSALKNAVMDFLRNPDGAWFFMGGQPGAGKTHLCTALTHELIKRGKSAKYMLWRDDVTMLKGMVNDGQAYRRLMDEYKLPDVLYIDDLFKMKRGERPTNGDINAAFEIINYRYNDMDKITIISTELSIGDILNIDQGLGSRIVERCGRCNQFIPSDNKKNYRLRRIYAGNGLQGGVSGK